MEIQKDSVIVLRANRYQDRHQIVTGLTHHHGKVTALAKNAIHSRRFGGCLELFCASEWSFQQKGQSELIHLSEARIKRDFTKIRESLEQLALASTLNELIDKVTLSNEPCPELFLLHSNALATVEEDWPFDYHSVLGNYLMKILKWCGNQPTVTHCLQCETPIESFSKAAAIWFDIARAGWMCGQCSPDVNYSRLQVEDLYRMQIFLHEPIRQSVQIPTKIELVTSLLELLAYHVPGVELDSFKSFRFLQSTAQPPADPSR